MKNKLLLKDILANENSGYYEFCVNGIGTIKGKLEQKDISISGKLDFENTRGELINLIDITLNLNEKNSSTERQIIFNSIYNTMQDKLNECLYKKESVKISAKSDSSKAMVYKDENYLLTYINVMDAVAIWKEPKKIDSEYIFVNYVHGNLDDLDTINSVYSYIDNYNNK